MPRGGLRPQGGPEAVGVARTGTLWGADTAQTAWPSRTCLAFRIGKRM